jgi:hypothetical protein
MSTNHRIRRFSNPLIVYLAILALTLFLSSQALADESSCIVCHTDIDLLEENLGDDGKKNSALQAGSG